MLPNTVPTVPHNLFYSSAFESNSYFNEREKRYMSKRQKFISSFSASLNSI